MENAVNRDIPDELLVEGREVYQGSNHRQGYRYKKASPKSFIQTERQEGKVVSSLREVLELIGFHDGMTVSFHHHFRDGDYVVNLVMKEIVDMGFKDITIAATSLGSANDPVADYIEQGIVTGIQTSGIRGKMGEMVSHGKLKTTAILRSHGGRVRAIEEGEVQIDVAFIGAPTSDCLGNARGKGGKSDCGVLGYHEVDARYADYVVVITDCLVDFPNFPPSIEASYVDYVVVMDEIGDPKKIATAAARFSTDPRDLLMAEYCAKVIEATPYFKDGFSFQTGAGGPSLAANRFLEPILRKHSITIGWIIGGITAPAVDLLNKGLVKTIIDTQDFDITAVESVGTHPRHFVMSTSQYASPSNKSAFVNMLDYVILAALEVDVDFNVNVVTGSDGVLRGAPGGHPDTAAGAKCSIIVTPLVRGRMATICESVVTITTPGQDVDVVVTDYGIAVNPRRPELLEALKKTKLPLRTIEELQQEAYSIVGTPDPLPFKDRVVAIVEARDGTILDVVHEIDPIE